MNNTETKLAGRRLRLIALSIALTYLLLAWCSSVFALDPALDVSQLAHTSWKIRDGFTRSRITRIAQTPDGYLWLGTELGLFRFDGVKNVPWQPPPGDQRLPSGSIFELMNDRNGTLWIGTDKGLASWSGNKLTRYPEVDGQFVFSIQEDSDGAVWVGTFGVGTETGKLCAITNGRVQCYGEDGLFGRGVLNLFEDKRGNLWAEGQRGLWRWKPGSPEFISLPIGWLTTRNLAEDLDGALMIGTVEGIKRVVGGRTEPYPLPGSGRKLGIDKLFRDSAGSLWIGTTSQGLAHVHQGKTDFFSAANGLSGDDIGTLFEDREGNIWVTTSGGLDRFHEFAVPSFGVKQGLLDASVYAALALREGGVLIVTPNGLNRFKDGQLTTFGRIRAEGEQSSNFPLTLFQDGGGRIWGVTSSKFGYFENDRFVSIPGIPGGVARAIVEGNYGDLWIANQNPGLLHLRGSEILQQISWDQLGHKDFASSLAFDLPQGGVWLGFFRGGIIYFRDNRIQASFDVANGLGEGRVNDLRLDKDHTLWAATEGGLSRLKNGRVATLTSKNGLPCNTVHWLTEDKDHSLWLNTTCGLVRLARAELDKWTTAVDQNNDLNRTIQVRVFDISDGVAIRSFPTGFSPQVGKSSDGSLWFSGLDGVSVIDPSHIPFNSLPPPVHIEQITVDHGNYDATSYSNGQMRLPSLIRDLQIDYTALSLVAPEKVLFRYKLEGYDRDWQDAGNRRQAFYTNLPPRNYRFRVMACNNDGVWNETGTFLDFSIAPAYYQTTWFRLLVLATFLVMLGLIYQLRLQQVARQVRVRMEERLDERERIARDLHDTLLQSVQGLILKVHAVAKQIPRDQPAHDAIEKTLDRADEVLAEGRDRVRDLRFSRVPVGGLPAAFKQIVEETSQGRAATFKTVVVGSVRELHPMVREECYRIGREALINALKHSQARLVEVEITYEPRQFRLRVRDDGHGIDPRILAEGGRADHWGMQGMRERADRIGAELKMWSGHKTGTEVQLLVPGATAYQTAQAKSKRSWFRRLYGNQS